MAGRISTLRKLVRRGWPLALEAKRRWDRMSPEEKERYKRQARDLAQRGRDTIAKRRGGGGRRGGRRSR
jgi:hypothetical protein